MKSGLRFIMVLWTGISLASCSSPSTVGGVKASDLPQARPDFSGKWILNTNASDNPQEVAKEALQAMRRLSGGRQGMGAGRGGRSGGMGRGQHKQGGPQDDAKREMYRQLLPLLDTAETLDISHHEPILLIGSASTQQQRIFTDFRGSSISASGGPQQRVIVAGWEGTVLVVETTLNSGSRIVQHYQLDTSAGQLKIGNEIQLEERGPISFQLVYDRELPSG